MLVELDVLLELDEDATVVVLLDALVLAAEVVDNLVDVVVNTSLASKPHCQSTCRKIYKDTHIPACKLT